jgi:hypothetical protein
VFEKAHDDGSSHDLGSAWRCRCGKFLSCPSTPDWSPAGGGIRGEVETECASCGEDWRAMDIALGDKLASDVNLTACPECKVPEGRCLTSGGNDRRKVHQARIDAAPAPDPEVFAYVSQSTKETSHA